MRTFGEAVRELRKDGYQLVIIGMHFDESRMFELLRYVRGLRQYNDVPVMCVQCRDVMLSEASEPAVYSTPVAYLNDAGFQEQFMASHKPTSGPE